MDYAMFDMICAKDCDEREKSRNSESNFFPKVQFCANSEIMSSEWSIMRAAKSVLFDLSPLVRAAAKCVDVETRPVTAAGHELSYGTEDVAENREKNDSLTQREFCLLTHNCG